MPRPLSDLLDALARVVSTDATRSSQFGERVQRATTVAPKLAWVHRTGRPSRSGKWTQIFHQRRLAAQDTGNPFEHMLKLDPAVYFFVGACAFPQGHVALLISPGTHSAGPSTFAPYDTGALREHLFPMDASAVWDAQAKVQHLETHLGHGADVASFVGSYLAAHFHDPMSYVRAAQQSEPDFAVHHGLIDRHRDRRAWTVEARVHTDIEISPDGLILQEIWLDHHDLYDEVPDDFKGLLRVIPDASTIEGIIARRIEDRIGRAAA